MRVVKSDVARIGVAHSLTVSIGESGNEDFQSRLRSIIHDTLRGLQRLGLSWNANELENAAGVE